MAWNNVDLNPDSLLTIVDPLSFLIFPMQLHPKSAVVFPFINEIFPLRIFDAEVLVVIRFWDTDLAIGHFGILECWGQVKGALTD